MKVICIDAKWRPHTTPDKNNFRLVESENYTVLGEFKGSSGRYGYELMENAGDSLYDKDRFIPLSEIDELILVNNKELVNESKR